MGVFRFVIEAAPQEAERDVSNNRLAGRIDVRQEKIRVLLVQGYPNFEYRYLRNLLSREPSIELHSVLQEADHEHAGQEKGALAVFPVRRDELLAYDVVILGDANPALFGQSGLANLARFVNERKSGGALLVMAGPRYMPWAYRDTPLAALLRITQRAALLPTLSYGRQQMHQFGAGVPTGGLFTASDIPDQRSVVQDASLQWQVKQWQVAYRVNLSDQDNRQPGRTLADFATQMHGVIVGMTVGSTLSLGLDLGLERQENKEFAQVNHVKRLGLTGNWRATSLTTLDGSLSVSRAEDVGAGSDAHVSSLQAGIAQGIRLWHSADGTPRGQLFLRFSRQSNDLYNLSAPFAPPTQSNGSWNVASGLTLRLF